MRFETGTVAVVTGASGGIGRALALELAGRGCDLALCDVSDGVEDTADAVRALGRRVYVATVDVSNRDQMEGFAAAVEEHLGPAKLLVNNAGVSLTGDMVDYSLEDWDWMLGVNLYGVIYGIHFFLPQLTRTRGHIVALSSLFGLIGVGGQSAYCATKFAVRGLCESIDQELRGRGVGVTSVHPGAVDTGIVRGQARYRGASDNASTRRRAARLIGRGMSAEEAARRIADAAEARRSRLVLTWDAWWMDLFARLFPTGYRWAVARWRKRLFRPARS